MKMKKWMAGITAVVLVFALCGCSLIKDSKPAEPEDTEKQTEEQTKEPADKETEEENNVPDEVSGTDITDEVTPDASEEKAELVNPRGDTVTVTKQADGTYSDGTETYKFDGKETWTDSKGAEWNEAAGLAEDDAETVELVNPKGDTVTVTKQADGTYSDGTETYRFDGEETWTDSKGTEWNKTVGTEE